MADRRPDEAADTLATWLYQRFAVIHGCPPWEQTTDDDRSYWEHEAAAVRRAVARNGFWEPAPASPLVAVDKDATGMTITITPAGAGEVR